MATGTPILATQKMLGGRSIVSDSWSAHQTYSGVIPAWQSAVIPYGTDGHCNMNLGGPGCGWWGHRDGYNVLYGDWHAKWYGDGQQKLLWWESEYGWYDTRIWWDPGHTDSLCVCSITAYNLSPYYARPGKQVCWFQDGSCAGQQSIWHFFDNDAGIDIGAGGGYSSSGYGYPQIQSFGGFSEWPTLYY
jgi:prepilin-type processing-associated H-X9-DG protein